MKSIFFKKKCSSICICAFFVVPLQAESLVNDNYRIMKKINYVFIVLFWLIGLPLFAQSDGLSVKRFEDVSHEKLYARSADAPRDNAGNYPALLLVQVLSESEASFTANYMIGEAQKKGHVYWVYMAEGAKYVEISLPQYEKIKVSFSDVSNGTIPALVSKCTYEMVINVPRLGGEVAKPVLKRQFFKVRVSPENAVVEVKIDGEWQLWATDNGLASDIISFGSYDYRVSAQDYYTKEGVLTLDDNHNEISVELQPNYGYLTIDANVSTNGASVYATNSLTNQVTRLGTVPLSPIRLSSAPYMIKLHKENYRDTTFMVDISDGKTVTLEPVLQENSTRVILKSKDFATIYMNGSALGKGIWTGKVEYGQHLVEVRADKYRSTYTSIQVRQSDTIQVFTLNDPMPIYGSIVVTGSPNDAQVYVDNKLMGTTPLILDRLMLGNYQLRVDKDGYSSYMQRFTVEENEEQTLQYTLSGNTPVEQAQEDAERIAREQAKAEALRKAELAHQAAEQKAKEEAERMVMEMQRKAREEALKNGEIMRKDYVDLGLPSGTLWKKTNEGGDLARYLYGEAISKFGNQLPTEAQMQELKDYCVWSLTGSEYMVIGPNGKSITLPTDGHQNCSGAVNYVGVGGYYWSFTRKDSGNAKYLFFDGNGPRILHVGQCYRLSVRLVL